MSQIILEIDTDGEIDKIIQKLNTLPDRLKAPDTLRKAVNAAGRKVRKQMISDAKGRYALKKAGAYNSESKIKTANVGDFGVEINAKGPMKAAKEFPMQGGAAGVTMKVLRASGMKAVRVNGNKGFLAFGGNAYARKGSSRLPLEKIMSPGVPVMMGQPEVVEPAIETAHGLLEAEIEKQIAKILG